MGIVGLLLIIVAGFSLIHLIAPNKSPLEKAGLSFLAGTGLVTISMVLIDALNLRITVLKLAIILLLFTTFVLWKEWRSHLSGKATLPYKRSMSGIRSGNFAWYLLCLIVVSLVLASAMKAVYWPPSAYDNITGYDLMGKITAAEGTFDNSLFGRNGRPMKGTAKRLIYPPMVSGSFAYAYLLGFQTSRIMSALFSIFFVTSFYALLKRESNYFSAILGTFFLIITPQFYAYTSLSTTNIPFAIYVSLGIIYLYKWLRRRQDEDLWLAALTLSFSGWTRYEGIIFGLLGLLLIGIFYKRKEINWRKLGAFGLVMLLPFVIWNLYVYMHFQVSQSVLYPYPYWDAGKASTILTYLINYVVSLDLFGLTFYTLPMALVINIKRMTYDPSHYLLLLILLSLAGFFLLYYQIDYNQFGNLEEVMQSSFRRGLFCFVPLCWFYFFSVRQMTKLGAYLCRMVEYRS